MRRLLPTLGTALALLLALVATAQARSIEYMSQHPLPRKIGHGFCYIDVPHFHDFPPSDPRLYRQVDGQYYFVGDPSPFEYEGPKYPYYGGHPVVEANVNFGQPIYCHLRGPHYHWYQPPPQASFELKGGAYWYTGAYPQTYYDERPRYAVVNEAYAPIAYTRPIVDVTVAPPSFHGEIIAAAPGFRGQAVVGAPFAPAVGVYVAAPPPPVVQVGVGVNMGGPPTVIERREVYEVREHHDNGRHRGWYKNGPPPGPPPRGSAWRGNPAPPPQQHGGGWRGNPPPAPAPHGTAWRGNPTPAPAPQGGGWHGGGGGGGKKQGAWRR